MNELCFNLWYYVDRQQNITAIAAKAYWLKGADEEKCAALLDSSKSDYRSLVPYKIKPVHFTMLQRLGIETLFSAEFKRIARELPKGTMLPDDKCYYATPLFDFGGGFVPATIGNGFIKERD